MFSNVDYGNQEIQTNVDQICVKEERIVVIEAVDGFLVEIVQSVHQQKKKQGDVKESGRKHNSHKT